MGLVALPEYDPEEEENAIAMPITGTGNEDLWSGPSLEEEREEDEEREE